MPELGSAHARPGDDVAPSPSRVCGRMAIVAAYEGASGFVVDPTDSGSPLAPPRDLELIMMRSHPKTEVVTPIEQSLAEACAVYGATEIRPRSGASWPAQLLAAAGTIAVLLVILSLMDDVKGWVTHRAGQDPQGTGATRWSPGPSSKEHD